MSGLMGGLIGAGIAGMLFGHGFMGGGLGFGGFLGFLLQIFLLVLVVRFVIRWFARRSSPAFAGGPGLFARNGAPPSGGGGGFGGGVPGGGGPPPIQVSPQDYQAYEQLLQQIQAAWSRHDLNAMRAITTPEMLSYFGEQLAEQASQGVRNEVTDVRLLQGDLAQAWSEGSREYATVAMRFSMIDITRDTTGRIVDGTPNEHVTATELWTFMRAPGGQWLLSAIQQTR
jgi:predicted lipid-binding transport protein (Tim44 family)